LTKLIDPLLSFDARGRIGKLITLTRRQKVNIAERMPIPEDPKSLAQLSWRHMYQKAVALWHALTTSEKQEWESLARRHHMTGYAYFLSQALKPNPGLYLPLQGGTMAGDINMAKNRILKLPLPTDDQEAASKVYVDTSIPPGGYTQGARVRHDTGQNVPTTTATILAFNTEIYDTDTIHDNVTNNSRLTCKTAGKYIIAGNIFFDPNATGRRQVGIRLNGTTYIAIIIQNATLTGGHGLSLSTIWSLNINEFVELVPWQDSGDTLEIKSYGYYSPEFMMQRIG